MEEHALSVFSLIHRGQVPVKALRPASLPLPGSSRTADDLAMDPTMDADAAGRTKPEWAVSGLPRAR